MVGDCGAAGQSRALNAPSRGLIHTSGCSPPVTTRSMARSLLKSVATAATALPRLSGHARGDFRKRACRCCATSAGPERLGPLPHWSPVPPPLSLLAVRPEPRCHRGERSGLRRYRGRSPPMSGPVARPRQRGFRQPLFAVTLTKRPAPSLWKSARPATVLIATSGFSSLS